MSKKIKIVNKKRFFATIFILLLVLILIFVITVYASESMHNNYEYKEYKEYIVAPGDTLWDIASENKNGKDIRTYIYKLKKLNDIQTSNISIGMKLKLP